jgi:uroporphyrinogen decarboxylase
VIFHSEGNLKLLIDDIVRCGIDGINPCEKRNMSVDFVRKNYPELLIWGGIDQFELLPNGTVQEVVAEVKRVLEVCSNGGYILGADGQVHPSCKADNVIAMFKAAKKQL